MVALAIPSSAQTTGIPEPGEPGPGVAAIVSSPGAVTAYSTADYGWCASSLWIDSEAGIALTSSALDCWLACLSAYPDVLVSSDWWPNGVFADTNCWCQDSCPCMEDEEFYVAEHDCDPCYLESEDAVTITYDSLSLPLRCAEYFDVGTQANYTTGQTSGSGAGGRASTHLVVIVAAALLASARAL